jgi:ribose 5-phosphate isomerase B
MIIKIYIASDHHGVKLKSALVKNLIDTGYEVEDFGPNNTNPVDYPEYANKACQAVLNHPSSLGILICGTGIGMCMSANKIDGILAGEANTAEIAARGRAEDHLNVLCLSADYTNTDDAISIVDAFIKTKPSSEERYVRRVEEVKNEE